MLRLKQIIIILVGIRKKEYTQLTTGKNINSRGQDKKISPTVKLKIEFSRKTRKKLTLLKIKIVKLVGSKPRI